MCNYYATKWKREPINDHKFDFVNVHDFRDYHIWTEFNYCLVVLASLKSLIKYIADIWTALVLLRLTPSSFGFLLKEVANKWIFLASILCSFFILLWDIRKSHRIIRSRDIAFAFTDYIAYSIYSLKSYDYYCLFHRIENSKNTRDVLAFFVFFRLKRWKRIILAEAPRQIINGYTLYSKILLDGKGRLTFNQGMFYESTIQTVSLIFIIISFTIFFISATCVIIALFLYVPLVCQIQGNLKEYVCHKIDKRIGKIIKSKARSRAHETQQRLQRASLLSSLGKSTPPSSPMASIPSPTLPQVVMEDEEFSPQPSPSRTPLSRKNNSNSSRFSRASLKNNSSSDYHYEVRGNRRAGSKKEKPSDSAVIRRESQKNEASKNYKPRSAGARRESPRVESLNNFPPRSAGTRSNSNGSNFHQATRGTQRRSLTTQTRTSRYTEEHPRSYHRPRPEDMGASSVSTPSEYRVASPPETPSSHRSLFRSIDPPSPVHF